MTRSSHTINVNSKLINIKTMKMRVWVLALVAIYSSSPDCATYTGYHHTWFPCKRIGRLQPMKGACLKHRTKGEVRAFLFLLTAGAVSPLKLSFSPRDSPTVVLASQGWPGLLLFHSAASSFVLEYQKFLVINLWVASPCLDNFPALLTQTCIAD